MKNNHKITAIVLLLAISINIVKAQISTDELDGRLNTISTAVPLMRISPNARSGAMGETGIAVSPDANSIHWNASKLAFVEKDLGLAVSYSPWLRQLVPDIYLAYLSGFKKLDDNQTLGGSLRYFSLGNIQFTNMDGEPIGEGNPNELALDLAYARKLSPNFSTALALRYIYSNLASGQTVDGDLIKAGTAIATDLSFYYNKDITVSEKDAKMAFGANISNIGSKISYTSSSERNFIPMNLGLGSAFTVSFDDYNDLTFTIDINKLLVPTPDTSVDYKSYSVPKAIFTSFADAPFGEEMQELMFSFGIEYWYDKQFAVRAGHFNEHRLKGNRKYFTVGIGLRYNVFGLDVSYLIPSTQRNPLDNTLRFTLIFDFAALKQETPEAE